MAFQGSLKELPLPDIIQLVSVSGKSGLFSIRNGSSEGRIFLRDGQIVDARVGDLVGEEAVYELAIWPEGDFVFTPGQEAETQSIKKSNTNLLMEAARRIDEWQVLSKRIPSTLLVPVFTNQVSRTSVSLTPQEWALVCRIDERRSIEEIALALGMSAFEACKVLYGLLTSNLVTLKENLGQEPIDRLQKKSPDELRRLASDIHQEALTLMAGHDRLSELETTFRLSKAELDSGREVDAVLDLIRNEEKAVSSALGPNQAKAFLDRVKRLLVSD